MIAIKSFLRIALVLLSVAVLSEVASARGAYSTATTPGGPANQSPYSLNLKALAKWGCDNSVEGRAGYAWFTCGGLLKFEPGTTYGNISKYWWGYYYNGEGPYPYYAIQWNPNAYPEKINCDQVWSDHPIHFGSGNKRVTETDLQAGSIQFVRYYNSNDRYSVGYLGAGWHHEFESRIDSPADNVAVVRGCGFTEVSYTYTPAGGWEGDADLNDQLIELKDAGGIRTGWRIFRSDKARYEEFDASGTLLSFRPLRGASQFFIYSDGTDGSSSGNGDFILDQFGAPTTTPLPAGLLLRVSDEFGNQISFGYDVQKRLTMAKNKAGKAVRYSYDQSANLISAVYTDGRTRSYRYGESAYLTSGAVQPNLLTGIIDESNHRFASYWYDSNARAYDEVLAEGALAEVDRTQISYTLNGSLDVASASVTSASGVTTVYGFTKSLGVNRVVSISRLAGQGYDAATTSISYDLNGNISSRIDINGAETRFSYDLSRNLETTRTEAFGTPRARTTSTVWHASLRLPQVVSIYTGETAVGTPLKTTTFSYDAVGNVLSQIETDPATVESRTSRYTYNGFGQVITVDGPRADATDSATYSYFSCSTGYECGRLQSVTDGMGHVTNYLSYDVNGNPTASTDKNGTVTTLSYDDRGRVLTRMRNGKTVSFEYFPEGMLRKVTKADGSVVSYSYDVAHRLTQVQDGEGNKIVYTLDKLGNRTLEQTFDASGVLSLKRTRVFDALGRLSQELHAGVSGDVATSYSYDSAGNVTASNSPLGRNSSSQYDEFGRVYRHVNAEGGVTQFGYGSLGQLTSVLDPRSLTTAYAYNAFGDLTMQSSPDTGLTANTYDAAGNIKSSTDARNLTAAFTYDAINRAIDIQYQGGESVHHEYDTAANGIGRIASSTSASATTAWSYTPDGQVSRKTQVIGAITQTVDYGYNNAGQLSTVRTPSGKTISYSYSNGRISSIDVNGIPVLTGVLYEPFGPTRSWVWGNGSIAVRVFDTDGRVTQINSAGLKTYGYDDASRITSIVDPDQPANSLAFTYDLSDRLNGASKSGLSQSFSYDLNGNRQAQGGTYSSTYTVFPSSNRLNAVSGAITRTYSYDNTGNVLSDGTTSYTYTASGRMASSTKSNVTTSYGYDALGQRVKKINPAGTTYFVYDEVGHLLGEYDTSGALIQEIVWLNDTPVATIRWGSCGMAIFYIHTDHLNSPRRVTKRSTTDVVWSWDSDAFGSTQANENPSGLGVFSFNLRFAGQYFDAETGNHYNYFRDYDPSVGRYVQSDPLGRRGGENTFAYVDSSPIRYMDPRGLTKWDGEVSKVGAAYFVGMSAYEFILTSECTGGKFAWVKVHAVGPTVGIEIEGLPLPPFVGTFGSVNLEDSTTQPNPLSLQGKFSAFEVDLVPGIGGGCSEIKMGIAKGAFSDSCGWSYGLDVGVSFTAGNAVVVNSSVTDCEECKK